MKLVIASITFLENHNNFKNWSFAVIMPKKVENVFRNITVKYFY